MRIHERLAKPQLIFAWVRYRVNGQTPAKLGAATLSNLYLEQLASSTALRIPFFRQNPSSDFILGTQMIIKLQVWRTFVRTAASGSCGLWQLCSTV